jgi:hypothetical protein
MENPNAFSYTQFKFHDTIFAETVSGFYTIIQARASCKKICKLYDGFWYIFWQHVKMHIEKSRHASWY